MSKQKDVISSFSEGMTKFLNYLSGDGVGGVIVPVLLAIGFLALLFLSF